MATTKKKLDIRPTTIRSIREPRAKTAALYIALSKTWKAKSKRDKFDKLFFKWVHEKKNSIVKAQLWVKIENLVKEQKKK